MHYYGLLDRHGKKQVHENQTEKSSTSETISNVAESRNDFKVNIDPRVRFSRSKPNSESTGSKDSNATDGSEN